MGDGKLKRRGACLSAPCVLILGDPGDTCGLSLISLTSACSVRGPRLPVKVRALCFKNRWRQEAELLFRCET